MLSPERFSRALALWLAVGILAPAATAGEVAILYDGTPGVAETLVDQGFQNLSSDLFNQTGFYSADAPMGVTVFGSGPENAQVASFFTHGLLTGNPLHPGVQELDRSIGYRVVFELAIVSESHDESADRNGDGRSDSAGFSIAVISSDLLGIGISFWSDRIWINEDGASGPDDLLTQAEGIAQPSEAMASLRRYELEVMRGAYRLRVGGVTLLTGRLRDYRDFEGVETPFGILNNFDKANSISLGDATDSARSRVLIGDISSETPHSPLPDARFALAVRPEGDAALRWGAVPGVVYSLRSSDGLEGFTEFEDIVADAFVMEFTDRRPIARRRFYKILPIEG